MDRTIKDLLILTILTIISSFVVWIPYILQLNNFFNLDFSAGINTIYRNFDGINYIIIAKSFYFPELISTLPQSLPANYYAAHFPGYSLLILVFAPLIGFLKSMIAVSLLFTILSVIGFYFLIKDHHLSHHPLLLSAIFLVIPARWFIVHSVGSAEPIFILFTIVAIYFFLNFEKSNCSKDIWLTAIFGSLAQITRPPGILFFGALGVYLLWKLWNNKQESFNQKLSQLFKNYYPLALVPLTLLGVFSWYLVTYNDFWAYFHSGDNIHLLFPPFQVFNKNQFWVGDIWLEDIIYVYIFGLLAGIYLWKKDLKPLAIYLFLYLGAAMFVAHRDISRYSLPIFPLVLIAFEKILTSKEFKIVLAIVFLAIYLYAQNFILANTAPIPNLEVFN